MEEKLPAVTVLCEYYHPEGASTAQLVTDLTTGLADRFSMAVVTGYPNYLAADREESVPARETHEGVAVERVRGTRFDKDRLVLRLVNWLSFTTLALARLLWSHRDDDLLVTFSNPPVLPLAAALASRLTGTPFVYVVYDMYPDMAVGLGLLSEDGFVARIWDRLMRRVYVEADRVVVLGESMRRRLEGKMAGADDFDPGKVAVIHNWADGEFIRPRNKSDNEFAVDHGTVEGFTLLYSGNVGRFHDVRTAVRAVGLLEERGRTDVQLLVVGEGAEKDALRELVECEGIEGVRFLPFQPLERLPESLTAGDASLVGIRSEMAGMCVSSKLYTSLAAGTPVLAVVGEDDEVAQVVEAHDCGAHVEPGDAEAAADVLAAWADDPEVVRELGANARRVFEERFRLEHALAAYADLFEETVAEAGEEPVTAASDSPVEAATPEEG